MVSLLYFQSYGWCPRGSACEQSHSVDNVLNVELDKRNRRKRKRNRQKNNNSEADDEQECDAPAPDAVESAVRNGDSVKIDSECVSEGDTVEQPTQTSAVRRSGSHRAGFDSFMTGYAFAVALAKHGAITRDASDCAHVSFEEMKNKVALSGKNIPLLIRKSNFEKASVLHSEKIKRIKSDKES